jgi:hypothetical protein
MGSNSAFKPLVKLCSIYITVKKRQKTRSQPEKFSIVIKEAVKEAGSGRTREEYAEIAIWNIFDKFFQLLVDILV